MGTLNSSEKVDAFANLNFGALTACI